MKITIDANYLKALFAVICVDDVRTYLHGVHLNLSGKEFWVSLYWEE